MVDDTHSTALEGQRSQQFRHDDMRLFFYIMGAGGLGHLSRAITIATAVRYLNPHAEILLLAEPFDIRLAQDAQIACISIAPFATLYRGSPWQSIRPKRRMSLWKNVVESTMEAFSPTVVIHDTYVLDVVKNFARHYNAAQIGIVRHSPWAETVRSGDREALWNDLDLVLIAHSIEEHGDIAIPGLPPERKRYTGSLVRRTNSELTPALLRAKYMLHEDDFVVVATNAGGSFTYATPSNTVREKDMFLPTIIEACSLLAKEQISHARVRVLIITGPLAPRDIPFTSAEFNSSVKVSIHDYEAFLPDLMAASQVVICRGGYNTINEILSIGVPAIAIPVPEQHDPDEDRIAWAQTQSPTLQAGIMDPEDIKQRLLRTIKQPYWHFTPVSSESDTLFQGKIAAAHSIIEVNQ